MNTSENQETVDFREELEPPANPGRFNQITEKIRVEHKGYAATIRLYRTAKGYWKIALDFSAPMSGFCTPASVWTGIAYSSDLAARGAAIEYLLSRRTIHADRRGKNGDLYAFRAKLEAELTPQLALF